MSRAPSTPAAARRLGAAPPRGSAPRRRRPAALALALASSVLFGPLAGVARAAERPKLVVLVVVDQLGETQLRHFGVDVFDRGIGRLASRGTFYRRGIYEYANTETAAGHATLATGAWPSDHGMVANYWYDPVTQARINCVQDPVWKKSPKNLLVPGVADAIQAASRGRAKTISVGIKDRATIILGGERPTAAVWYDAASGRFQSGTWYRAGEGGAEGGPLAPEPSWATAVSLVHGASQAYGARWDRARPDLDYARLAGPDDVAAEIDVPGVGRTFPHALGAKIAATSAEWREHYPVTPDALDAVFELATRAFDAEALGQRGETDYLALALSSLDYAGHLYGPHAQETFDLLLRIDAGLGRLVDHVEGRLGRGAVLWVLTSDHGVAETPEVAHARGARAERVDQRALARVGDEALRRVAAELGAAGAKRPAGERISADRVPTVLDINAPRVYVRWPDPKMDRLPYQRALAEALARRPEVIEAHASADLAAFPEPHRTLFERSNHTGRDADVLILQRPGDVLESFGEAGPGGGSSHGTPYLYDQTVPLVLAGPGVPRAEDERPYLMTRLAPTIAALLGIEPPAAARALPLPFVENQ